MADECKTCERTRVSRLHHEACPDCDPVFPPLMLSGLTYAQAKLQARITGCAIRRPHWCNPVLIWEGDRLWMDDEGETIVWSREGANEDMRADDWIMVERDLAALNEQPR